MFGNQLVFNEGEELNVQMFCNVTSGVNIEVEKLKVLIYYLKR